MEPHDDRAIPTDCPHCGDDLNLLQPDPDLPDRLLGTCGGCRGWFLIEASAGTIRPVPSEWWGSGELSRVEP